MTLVDDTSDLARHAAARPGLSPEQRMNVFHAERRTEPPKHPFEDRRARAGQAADSRDESALKADSQEERTLRADSQDERTLKAARAEAVESVVKAFAAIDRNIALADKARHQIERTRAEAERAKREADKELATARRMREDAERFLAQARTKSEELLRDVIGQARATIDSYVDSTARDTATHEVTIDVRGG